MRKMLWTTSAIALIAAPAAGQQIEKSPFAAVPAASTTIPAPAAPEVLHEPATPRAPSLHVSAQQIDAELRAQAEARGERQERVGNRAWWYMVAAIAAGVAIALVLFN